MVISSVTHCLHPRPHRGLLQNFSDSRSLAVVLREQGADHVAELLGVLAGDGGVDAADDFHDEGALILRLKGMPKGTQLVEHAAQGPDVALVVVGLFFAEFGGEVVGRAYDGVRHILCLIQQLGDAQITNLDLVLLPQKHVRRFDIPVQYLVLVEVLEAEAHLNEELPYLLLIQRPIHLLFQKLAEVPILAILHDNIYRVFQHKRVVVLDDVLALHLCHYRCLKHRLLLLVRVHFPRIHHLHHIQLAALLVPHRVHDPKGSLAQFLQLFKVTLLHLFVLGHSGLDSVDGLSDHLLRPRLHLGPLIIRHILHARPSMVLRLVVLVVEHGNN